MNTRKTILAASVVALGLLGHPILSQAFDGDRSGWSARDCGRSTEAGTAHGWGRLADRLNLTREQRQSMNAIEDKYRPALRDLRQALSDNRAALAKLEATDAKLPELAAAQGKTLADLIVARKNLRSEMDKVLTPEQRQKMGTLLERRRHHAFPREGGGQG